MLTLCHNPVRAYDLHEACGETGERARVGDLRHNFIFYWPYASRAPWGGIADWNADPLTGQIIGAAALDHGPLGDVWPPRSSATSSRSRSAIST